MTKIYYILVADGSRAKIYRGTKPLRALEIVYDQVRFQSRKRRSEIDADRPGMQKSGSLGFHSYAGDRDSHDHEEDEFARELCNVLRKEREGGKFDCLMIAASPRFLGALRKHLSRECEDAMVKSLDKDLIQSTHKEVIAHFA